MFQAGLEPELILYDYKAANSDVKTVLNKKKHIFAEVEVQQ